jgi:hypothetical protein
MGPHAVFPPQSSFRNTLGNLHHVFDLQRRPLRKRLCNQLRPAGQLRACPDKRFAGADHPHLTPHRTPKRAAQFFHIVKRTILFVLESRFVRSQRRNFFTARIGYRRSSRPCAKDQSFE